MRLIATTQNENEIVDNLATELKNKGVYSDVTHYEDGFGITVWSINDLQDVEVTQSWPRDEKMRFMESCGHKLGGATEDHWEILRELVSNYISKKVDENDAYVIENQSEFDKTKFYLDVCGGGWVRMLSYNPNSNAGGQFVDDLLSNHTIAAAGKAYSTEDEFWNCLYENSKQTLVDIDTPDFSGYAKEFIESPYDFEQNFDAIEKLIKWAETSLESED